MMEESTVLRKSEAVESAASIDSAVISSVRRHLLRDRLKCWSKALLSAMDHHLSPFSSFEPSLTIWVRWIQPQRLQGLCACAQKEPYALHPEEVHMTETKSAKKGNHSLH